MFRTYMAVRTSGCITFFIGTPVGNTCTQQGVSNNSVKENTEASVFFSNENGLDLIIRKLSTQSCLETSMQCKITTSIYKWFKIL